MNKKQKGLLASVISLVAAGIFYWSQPYTIAWKAADQACQSGYVNDNVCNMRDTKQPSSAPLPAIPVGQ